MEAPTPKGRSTFMISAERRQCRLQHLGRQSLRRYEPLVLVGVLAVASHQCAISAFVQALPCPVALDATVGRVVEAFPNCRIPVDVHSSLLVPVRSLSSR